MTIKARCRYIGLLTAWLAVLTTSAASAQSATVRGTILDAVTSEPLPWANVILIGTSIGGASDIEGKFIIRNVPVGSHTVRATYIGYEIRELEVVLTVDQVLELELHLDPVSLIEEEVVVTAQASGQTEAINRQLSSLAITNVVSGARIQELPDANAAESVARLPGVSIIREGGEGARVVVRGLSPQYNQIAIDGVQLPGNVVSNNPNEQASLVGDRATDLSMISSSILGGIDVVKAITPDMDAAVIGGVVNFGLRKAKTSGTRPVFGLTSQGGYNDLKGTYADYRLVGSLEHRVLNQRLGLFLQGTTEKRNRSANRLAAHYVLNDKSHGDDGIPDLTSVDLSDVFSEKQRHGATLVVDYNHDSGEVGMLNFFSTSETGALSRGQSFVHAIDDITYSGGRSSNDLMSVTNLLSIRQEVPLFDIDLKLSHTYSRSQNPEDFTLIFLQDRAGYAGQGDLSKSHPSTIAASGIPDSIGAKLKTINSSKNVAMDRSLTGSVGLERNLVTVDVLSSKVKLGGSYQYRKRSYDIDDRAGVHFDLGGRQLYARVFEEYPELNVYNGDVVLALFTNDPYSYRNFLAGDYSLAYPMNIDFMEEIIGIAIARDVGFIENEYRSLGFDYNGSEAKSAAYGMLTVNIGEKIALLPGMRFQNLRTSYTGNRGVQLPDAGGGIAFNARDTTATNSRGFLLPMVHARYKPLRWLQIHFAYTNTLNYPDYSAIVPRYDVSLATIIYNNYSLRTASSENIDLAVSLYGNAVGLFTVNAFRKRIEDLIFPSTTFLSDLSAYPDLPQGGQGNGQLYNFSTFINNPNPTDVRGIEIDWQTHPWYLLGILSNLVFNINYTRVFSEANYPRTELDISYDELGTLYRTVVDTFYTSRLLHQPNDIFNLAVGFDYRGFSARVSALYQDNIFKKPDFWLQQRIHSDKYTRWDLAISQRLPWFGMQAFFNLNNITGVDDIDLNQKTSFPALQERYGMTADIGLRVMH
jgi:TonB-dependent receptor